MSIDRSKPHYSISQVKLFSICQQKYFWQYVERLPYYSNYAMVSGKALHAGLEENNLELIAGKKGLTKEQLVESAVASYEDETENIEDFDVEIDAGKDKLVKEITPTTEVYLNDVQPQLIEDEIVSAEQAISVDIHGIPFVGYVDITTKSMLFDYKTLGRRKSKDQINYDPQLVAYEKIIGKQGGFISFLRGKPITEINLPERSQGVTDKLWTWVSEVIGSIECAKKTGDFTKCEPTNWMCNKCSFRFKCFNRK